MSYSILVPGAHGLAASTFIRKAKAIYPDIFIVACDVFLNKKEGCESDKYYDIDFDNESNDISRLEIICFEHKIQCIVPTSRSALLAISSNKERFESIGISFLIRDRTVLEFCDNKKNYEVIKINGLQIPKSIALNSDVIFPIFAKKAKGAGGVGRKTLQSNSDLTSLENKHDYIFQPLLKGREYSVDLWLNDNNSEVCIAVRERLSVLNGTCMKCRTLRHPRLENLAIEIAKKSSLYGMCCIQFIVNNNDDVYLIDINPWFGGGYGFSEFAGANFTELFLSRLNNKTITPTKISNKLLARSSPLFEITDIFD